jgi:hypothetical protein
MAWFDVNSDQNLLHESVRGMDDLINIAARVEELVIEHYRTGNDPIGVSLTGWDNDPAQADAGLRNVMKRTIADVISYVGRNYNNLPGVVSQRQGNRSISYVGMAGSGTLPTYQDFPSGWQWRLRRYSLKEEMYAI